MPSFEYKALAADGSMLRGRIAAVDASAATRQLQSQGHMPVSLRESGRTDGWVHRFTRDRGQGLGAGSSRLRRDPHALALATRELAILMQAGQTVEQALRLLSGVTGPVRLRPAFATALGRLRDGGSLADGLEAAGRFPPLYLAMVQAGEASGALESQLLRLADMLERGNRLKDGLLSALLYPMILMIVAVLAVILLLGFVVPQFAPLFAHTTKALPFATQVVLGASNLMRADGPTALVVIAVAFLAVAPLTRRPAVVRAWSRRQLRIPVIGPLLVMIATSRLARSLGVLLKGGVSLPKALTLVRGVAGNLEIADLVDTMRAGIKDGKGLSASLPPGHPLPALAVQLLGVGEQSGRLEDVLINLADIFDEKVDQSLKRLMAIFEPACVLVLSVVVGTIVVSILLAVVSINELAF